MASKVGSQIIKISELLDEELENMEPDPETIRCYAEALERLARAASDKSKCITLT